MLELFTLVSVQETADDDRAVAFLAEYLERAGDSGNESAADCARIVMDFGAIADTLRAQTVNAGNATFRSNDDSGTLGPSLGAETHDMMQGGVENQGGGNFNASWASDIVFEGKEATYEELFSWFIESPV